MLRLSGCAWSPSKSCISKYSFEYSYEFLMFIWLSSCAWLFSKLSVSNYSHSHFYRFRNIPMSIRWCLVARKVTDLKLFLYTFLWIPNYSCSCQVVLDLIQNYRSPTTPIDLPIDFKAFLWLSDGAWSPSKRWFSRFPCRYFYRFPSNTMVVRRCLFALRAVNLKVSL